MLNQKSLISKFSEVFIVIQFNRGLPPCFLVHCTFGRTLIIIQILSSKLTNANYRKLKILKSCIIRKPTPRNYVKKLVVNTESCAEKEEANNSKFDLASAFITLLKNV